MKILLVYPNMRGMNMLPPAIALFSALLKERGHQVDLFDATDYPNPEEDSINSDKHKEENLSVRPFDDTRLKITWLEENVFISFKKKIQTFTPDLVAMSCTEDMFPIGISLLRNVKVNAPVIMGGVFPTFAKDVVLSYDEVDMICIGEGEHLLVDLCDRMEKGIQYDDIPGLWLKQSNKTIRRNPMGLPVDMNLNPKLDLEIFSEGRLYRPMQGKVWRMFPLETHRGCPYQCAYCNSPSQQAMYKQQTNTSFFRKKNLDKIREEIILFRDKYKAEALYFWADTFFAYTEKEFDAFIEMYSEFNIPFWCQTRPETVTYNRVKQLTNIGMFRLAFGIEHGNAKFRRDYIKRNISNDFLVKAMQKVNKVGVPYSVNNILGFPFETRKLTFDTIELNRRIKADNANAYSFSPFHGTPLRKVAEDAGFIEKNLIARSITRPTLLDMPQYSKDQIEGMRKCFNLYVKLPKKRWPEIEKSEANTPKGKKLWEELRNETEQNNIEPDWKIKPTIKIEEIAMGV